MDALVSVVICTHNPRRDCLERTAEDPVRARAKSRSSSPQDDKAYATNANEA